MHPLLLLEGERGEIDLDFANNLAPPVRRSLAAVVRLHVQHLNLKRVVALLDIERDHFVPDWIVRQHCIFRRVTVSFN